MNRPPTRLAVVAAALVAVLIPLPATARAAEREQSTQLISRALDGGLPNGASTHAVISNDKRYARVIAFESDASNLIHGDANGTKDVFAVRRAGRVGNDGAPWRAGSTVLVSRTRGGRPANGPSYAPAVSGGFHQKPSCVAFLSQASNLVRRDTNGVADAFVARIGRRPRRVSLPRRRQSAAPTRPACATTWCSGRLAASTCRAGAGAAAS